MLLDDGSGYVFKQIYRTQMNLKNDGNLSMDRTMRVYVLRFMFLEISFIVETLTFWLIEFDHLPHEAVALIP